MEKLTIENIKKCKKGSGIYHFCVGSHNYIGSSIDVRKRLRTHIWAMQNKKHRNRIIQNCYNKYSLDNFYFEIVEYCDKEARIKREKYYIDLLHPDLNVTDPISLKRGKLFSIHVSEAQKRYYKTHITASRIPIYQYSITGDYITEYSCATEVANMFGICVSAVTSATNGRSKTCRGFQWRKVKLDRIESLIKEKVKKEKPKHEPKPGNKKRIYRYSFSGDYMDSFESASEADRKLGIKGCSLAARGKGPYRSMGGFMWSYIKVDKLPPYENHSKDSRKRKIVISDTDTGEQVEFDCIAAAVRTLFPNYKNFDSLCAIISSCAHGRLKSFRKHYTACYK